MADEYALASKVAVKRKGKREICYIFAGPAFQLDDVRRLPPVRVAASTDVTGFNFRKSSMRLPAFVAQSFRLKPNDVSDAPY
jgi:hypothetical protein